MADIDLKALWLSFREEAEEQLGEIESSVLAVEKTPLDRDRLKALFRRAHTLKGNASVVGFSAVVERTHLLEDCLQRLANGSLELTKEIATSVLTAVDELRAMIAKGQAPSHGEESPGAASSGGHGEGVGSGARTLRIGVERLDRMLALLGEITVARGRLGSLLDHDRTQRGSDARDAHHDADGLLLELQEQVMRARMVPLGPMFQAHARTVRDLALSYGKDVNFVISGEEVEIDMAASDGLRDPLVHMLRNAIGHGLESPAERAAAGKATSGTIRLSAAYQAGRVLVELSDDGRGISLELIRERAREVFPELDLASLGEEELRQLIFEPGFSTAREVTELSGRGVGLDVVRRNVEALRGDLRMSSEPGRGTTFHISLPLTIAIIDGFSVAAAGQTYVLPLETVVECVELPVDHRTSGEDRGILSLRGHALPYVRLRELVEAKEEQRPTRESVVVVRYSGREAGVVVDELLGEGQTVIKPLPRTCYGARGVSGATLLGNGEVALILDVPAILRSVDGNNMARTEALARGA